MNVENVVASTKLADEFDLYKIEAELEGAEYKKEKFPGLVYRVKAPKAAFLIFTSGKIVCTGAKNIEDIRRVIITLAEELMVEKTILDKSKKFEDLSKRDQWDALHKELDILREDVVREINRLGDQDVALLVSRAGRLPVSSSSIDRVGLAECEQILGIDFLAHLDPGLAPGAAAYRSDR